MIKIVQKDPFQSIVSAVNKAVDIIKPTYGPSSNKVIISKILNKGIYDDGVQIARNLEFNDPVENAVLNVIREVAVRTNDRVGDGTTGSLIMIQAIVNEFASLINRPGYLVEKDLKKALEEAKKQLLKMAVPINTKDDLRKVARISFDDKTISEIIADTWFKIGKDGVVTVDRSQTMETFSDVTDGIFIDRGYISPYMINNPSRMEGVVEKPYILLTDYRITETGDILPIMNKMADKKIFNLVLICENIESAALATVIVNRVQGSFNLIAINTPSAENRTVVLEDMAILTGAKVFSEGKGDKLENVEIEDLGRADRFISRRKESVIVGPRGKKEDIAKAIKGLRDSEKNTKISSEKVQLKNRLAMFSNKVAVIKVGAATEQETNTLKEKIDDAVNATQSAFKGGVVAGGGIALSQLHTSSDILNKALQVPHIQLCKNMGINPVAEVLEDGEALNVVTGKGGKFMEVGVMDPVDVLIAGIESAVSIASLLITTSGIIVEPPQKPRTE